MTEPSVIDRREGEGPWSGSIHQSDGKPVAGHAAYLCCDTAGANLWGHSLLLSSLDRPSRAVATKRCSWQKAGSR